MIPNENILFTICDHLFLEALLLMKYSSRQKNENTQGEIKLEEEIKC